MNITRLKLVYSQSHHQIWYFWIDDQYYQYLAFENDGYITDQQTGVLQPISHQTAIYHIGSNKYQWEHPRFLPLDIDNPEPELRKHIQTMQKLMMLQ